ncbi:MAG: class II aldolase/adducin family protein [Firmicutes bacterium]|nr:class II aldolase/adducin family protein [Bacillota bacterium]
MPGYRQQTMEWDIKTQLMYGCKIVALDGQGDLIWGHLTARDPEQPDRLFMKPAAMGLEEIAVEDLIQIDLSGQKVGGERQVHNEVFIHTEIMRRRPEVQCVVHTHAPWAVAFGSLEQPLVPVGHEGSLFADGLPVFSQFTDLVVTPERGEAVASALGAHNAILLRNHGLVTCGTSIPEAVMTAVFLEKACRVQMMAMAAGGPKAWTPPEEAQVKKQRIYRPWAFESAFRYLVRRIEEMESGRARS